MDQIAKLAERVKKSNQIAFNKLFNLLWEDLYVYAKSIIMDENSAKDILQEVWIDYWNRRKQIKNDNIKAYLLKAIKFKVYNFFRDNKFNSAQLNIIQELPVLPSIEEQHDLENIQYFVKNSIEDLPPRCKEIFSLSKLQGFNNKEIANKLGVSIRTVENQLSLALKKVKLNIQVTSFLIISTLTYLLF